MLRFRLFGKLWTLRWVPALPAPDQGGEADNGTRTLSIAQGMSAEDDLRLVIHEVLHAADWKKREPWVDETSRVLARVLTRLGWWRS